VEEDASALRRAPRSRFSAAPTVDIGDNVEYD
jgi:hypothetical protein